MSIRKKVTFWYDDFKEYFTEHKNERELLINVWDYGWLEPDGTFHPVSWVAPISGERLQEIVDEI